MRLLGQLDYCSTIKPGGINPLHASLYRHLVVSISPVDHVTEHIRVQ